VAAPAAPPITLSTDPHMPAIVRQAQRLFSGDDELWRHMADAAGGFAVNLALAGLILAATVWASGVLSRMTARAIYRAHRGRHPDTTLQTFTASLVRYFVVIVGLVGVLQQLGVRATSVIAVLGAASLAIGLALQGALSNVAAGVMILILRPYRIGDSVRIDGKEGVVKGMDLFSTRLADPDNLTVFVPNSKAFGEIITNLTAAGARRVATEVTIDRQDDVEQARRLMLAVAGEDRRVLKAPAGPWANLTAINDSGFVVTLRCYVTPADYANMTSDLMLAVVRRFRESGLSIPYPHQVAVESRPFRPPEALAERMGEDADARREDEPRSFAPRASSPAKPRGRGKGEGGAGRSSSAGVGSRALD
jgi:small conductance mechanosensitive channel